MNDDTLRKRLRTLLEFSDQLREKGFEEMTIGGVSFKLAPLGPVEHDSVLDGDLEDYTDPMDDPGSYAGGHVPGYDMSRIRRSRDE